MTKTSYERSRQLRNALDTGITDFQRDLQSLHVKKEDFKNKYSDTWRQNKNLKLSLTHVKEEHEKLKNKYEVLEQDLQSLHVKKEYFKNKYSDTWLQNKNLKVSLTHVKEEHEKLKNKYEVLEQKYNNLKQKLEEMSNDESDTDEDDDYYYSYRASELQDLVDEMLKKCFEYLHGFSATPTQLEHENQMLKKGMNVCNQVAKQKLFTSSHDKHHDRSVAAGITFFILQERFTLSWSFMHKAIKVTGPTIRDVSRVLRAKII